MLTNEIGLKPPGSSYQQKRQVNITSKKFYALLLPIPTVAIILISLVFNIFIWQAIGLKKQPDRPFEEKLVDECY